VLFAEPTVNNWLGRYVDKQSGGEVNLQIDKKQGDTVTVTLNDQGLVGGVHGREATLPLAPLSLTADVDLSAGRTALLETLIVHNVANLPDGVTLTLYRRTDSPDGQWARVKYDRPSTVGMKRTLELDRYEPPPR
jgi:hypothetical protein